MSDALGVEWAGSIQKTWLEIIGALGGVPDPDTDTSDEGSGTITDTGFEKVLYALDALVDAPLPEGEAAREISTPTPGSEEAGRRRVLAEVTRRQGQPAFRRALLEAYGGACCVTGVADLSVVETAHIRQYDGPATNIVRNGLPLRADLHTLFDRGLIAIDDEYRVIVSPELNHDGYRGLHGRQISLPPNPVAHPALEALAAHRAWSGL